jgi:hypothetical protein
LKESNSKIDSLQILKGLFGDNRAEWSPEHFKELFVVPPYFKKLEALRPCFLVGGRGTGKTTSLQSLHFLSTFERLNAEGLSFEDQTYLGIHIRLNKNRVRAFQNGSLDAEQWRRTFAHYINLLVSIELTQLSQWLEKKQGTRLSLAALQQICTDLAIDTAASLEELLTSLKKSLSSLQLYVNNSSLEQPVLSIAEAPIRTFVEALRDCSLLGDRVIYCCFDEYENLLDDQQAVLNTYIKHAEPPLSYKIGVRKNGLRNRQTSDEQDLLRTPDDYAEIEIADEGFEFFAKAVAELRLQRARTKGVPVGATLNELLQDLTVEEEATLLGGRALADEVLDELRSDPELYNYFKELPVLDIYFLLYWQESTNLSIAQLARDRIANSEEWKTRIGNHGFASLFWLSKGKKGVRVRKYYCGAKVFLALPAGNIRYFLELIDKAISFELDHQETEIETISLSPISQTLAARDVGLARLNQLEGLADHGVQLKRLVLGIGKVFFELARSPAGKSPEVTSFVLSGDPAICNDMREFLAEGVGHLAIEATPRTKATSANELKDEEYRLHPIFCAFFEISHRRKRRTTFDAKTLLQIIERPATAISKLLNDEDQSESSELPTQLAFFSAFYDGGKE